MEFVGDNFGVWKERLNIISIGIAQVDGSPEDVFSVRDMSSGSLKFGLGFADDGFEHFAFVVVDDCSDELGSPQLFVLTVGVFVDTNS